MNKKLIAAIAATTMAGAIGFASVAAAAEFNWYGSLRAGLVSGDDGKAKRLDLGATGNDGSVGDQGLYSRIGIKASTDLGNGSSAGLKLERGVGKDSLGTRHSNVWIGGGWGKLTFGQQGNPYRNARKWDQTWFLGGQFAKDGGTRVEGLQYSLAKGPFSFSVMAEANDVKDDEVTEVLEVLEVLEVAEVRDAHGNLTTAAVAPVAPVAPVAAKSNDGVDAWTITAGYDFGAVNLDVSHRTSQINNKGFDNTAIGLNGSAGLFGWYLAYQKADDNSAAKNDVDSIGGYVSFALSDNDKLYFYHVSHDADKVGAFGKDTLGKKPTESILGYSHSFGGGVSFIGEYLTIDKDLGGSDPNVLALALKVDF